MNNKRTTIDILGETIGVTDNDYISLTDMLKAKDGEFATIKKPCIEQGLKQPVRL